MATEATSPLTQDHSRCLADAIGAQGLSRQRFQAYAERAAEGAMLLRERHERGRLPHLAVALRDDDLAAITERADAIRRNFADVILCGTGGSSLGGQALAQVAGWRAPITAALAGPSPRLHFADNLDAFGLDALLHGVDPATAHFIVISKSGGTAETLAQLLLAADLLGKAGLPLKDHVTTISDPPSDKPNGLRAFLGEHGVTVLDHEPHLGGRYSALSNVGLLPAAIAGLDIATVRHGARAVIAPLLDDTPNADWAPLAGAALSAGLALEKGCAIAVLMAYSDRLERFTRWFAQLWAESLGKQGKGSTPAGALGPVDQHSQLQLYLDGPRDKLFTVIQTGTRGSGPRIPADLAAAAGADALGGRSIGDLVDSMQRATADTLAGNGRPVRTLHVDSPDAGAIGALMMHFMVETILAAHILEVDPFDQPAVEEGKRLAMRYLAEG